MENEKSTLAEEKPKFIESEHCTSHLHCATCRQLLEGREFRRGLMKVFSVPDNKEDFACPLKKIWIISEAAKSILTTRAKAAATPPSGGCGCKRKKSA